jgi:hypothetical protein
MSSVVPLTCAVAIRAERAAHRMGVQTFQTANACPSDAREYRETFYRAENCGMTVTSDRPRCDVAVPSSWPSHCGGATLSTSYSPIIRAPATTVSSTVPLAFPTITDVFSSMSCCNRDMVEQGYGLTGISRCQNVKMSAIQKSVIQNWQPGRTRRSGKSWIIGGGDRRWEHRLFLILA